MKQLKIESFKEISILDNVKYSPDGSRTVFHAMKPNTETDGYDNTLWLLTDGKLRQLTYGNREREFIFLDDNTVLFRSDKEADRPNYSTWQTIDLETGVIRSKYRFPIPTENLIMLENGDVLLCGSTWRGYEDLYLGKEEDIQKFTQFWKDETDFEVLTTYPWWNNGGPFTRGLVHSLYLYHAEAETLERLTPADADVTRIKISEDQKTVYYMKSAAEFRHTMTASLCMMDLSDRKETELLSDTCLISDYVPCSDRIVAAFTERTHGFCSDPDLYVIDPKDPQPQLLAPLDRSMHSLKCSEGKVWFIATDYDSSHLCTVEDGKVVKKTTAAGLAAAFDVHGDQFIVSAQFDTRPHELYDRNENRLTGFNDAMTDEYFKSVPEPIPFEARICAAISSSLRTMTQTESIRPCSIFTAVPKVCMHRSICRNISTGLRTDISCCLPTSAVLTAEAAPLRTSAENSELLTMTI